MDHKERINYVRDGEYYVGCPVNISGIVVQAKSLDELKRKCKAMYIMHLNFMKETIDQEEPFELVEMEDKQLWLYGSHIMKLREELQRYKDTFGELPKTE